MAGKTNDPNARHRGREVRNERQACLEKLKSPQIQCAGHEKVGKGESKKNYGKIQNLRANKKAPGKKEHRRQTSSNTGPGNRHRKTDEPTKREGKTD